MSTEGRHTLLVLQQCTQQCHQSERQVTAHVCQATSAGGKLALGQVWPVSKKGEDQSSDLGMHCDS